MLDKLLKEQGYKEIPLRQTDVGHFEVRVTINETETIFLVDTGAANTVIDVDFARENHLCLHLTSIQGGGAGSSTMEIYQLDPVTLSMFEFSLQDIIIYAIDFQHVKESLIKKGEKVLPNGVIGADILIPHKAVIDYANQRLYLN